ncbi:Rossmann-like and DUF2520 domain-containing protein [Aeromicrobium sp.]|uniref:Rossmann-like and DUF2520 domain-containing protein n=1 Tax=Aeromicrobium sp. TaxID=1871063 RepID=UPI003D6C1281
MTRLSIGVIGAGRVGSVLAAKFRAVGHPIVGVSGRSPASQLRIQTLLPPIDGHSVEVLAPAEVAARGDVLLLAVPDDALIRVAEELASVVRPRQVVLHTSGRHGTDALAALARAGARTIAFHPAMTFTGTDVDLDRTCVFGLTAATAERALAEELVADLGGTPMWVDEADRTLYHSALAHGANHLVTLVAQSMDLLRQAGSTDPAAVLRPLLGAALDNVLDFGDAALTGPVVRGDVTTIRAHADALAADSDISDTYLALARATTRRAELDGRLSPQSARDIRQVLTEAEWDALAESAVGVS